MAVVITMRRATPADAHDVFEWRNDPQTRQASISQGMVDWDAHQTWFANSLQSAGRHLYIAQETAPGSGATSVGIVRFDRSDDSDLVEVSINVSPGHRGRGIGAAILQAGLDALRDETGMLPPLSAIVRADNVASLRLFEGAGFVESSRADELVRFRRDAEKP